MRGSLTSRSNLLRVFGTLFAVLLMAYLLWQHWEDILASLTQLAWGRLALAFGFMLLSRLAVMGRWHALLLSAGTEIKFSLSARITYAGLFATNFLPTTIGGDVVRLAGAVQAGLDAALATASLIVDRLVGMLGMALILPVGMLRVAALLAARPGPWLAAGLVGRLGERLRRGGRRMLHALLLWRRQPRGLLAALGLTLVHMLGFFGCLYVLLNGLGEPMSFWRIGGLWSLVYFVTLLPVSINGLGLQEVSFTYIFSTFGGISDPASVSVALIFRTLMMLASLPGALFLPDVMAGVEKAEPLLEEEEFSAPL
jgi:hypothetical protein